MQKIRYEVDPHNRLTRLGPGKFRTVLDGEFKLDDGNSLSYHVKKSDNIDIPQQIKFSGNWSLDKGHNLILTLDKWNNQVEGNKLVLKSDLVTASGSELVFSVETRRGIYILKFGGAWQSDKHNRLSFNVVKERGNAPGSARGSSDKLTLQGKWDINKQNELVYMYPKNIITLRGYWDITEKNRLLFCFDKGLGSGFDLKATFQRAEKDSLRYGVSFGYGERKRTVTLFGKWRFDKNTGLSFEIKYAGKGVKVEAELSRSLLKGQGEGFVKALVSEKEYAVMAGAGWRW